MAGATRFRQSVRVGALEEALAEACLSHIVEVARLGTALAKGARGALGPGVSVTCSIDVTSCPVQRGDALGEEVATTPEAIARLLAKHGLAARPPPHERPSPPGQLKLRFDA